MEKLPDIQKTIDTRNIAIDWVGVESVELPVELAARCLDQNQTVHTVASFSLSVSLASHVKGTHMSRFTEILNQHIKTHGYFSADNLKDTVIEVANKLDATKARITIQAPFFTPQPSPVTGKEGMAPARVGIIVTALQGAAVRTILQVEVSGKTCCPCSRLISDYDTKTGKGRGAHAQRGKLLMEVHLVDNGMVWFEELIDIAKRSFSSPVYPVLKREDEKHVTTTAYDNPKFVEDVVRDAAVALRSHKEILQYSVKVVNAESIHYHDAFAVVSGLAAGFTHEK